MVLLKELIGSFSTVLCIVTQFAQFMALFWFVRVPEEPYSVEPYDGANEELHPTLVGLRT
jgi:hypothetical protein